jgi:uncharacterized membrane protein YciS (DUF1049 family)
MEDQKIMSPLIKGVLISLVVIILGIAGYFTGIGFEPWYNWVVNGILFIAIVIACIHYANQKDGYVTFGNVFSHGFKISAFVAIILVVYSVLSTTLLFPELKDKAIEMQRQRMEERGTSDDQIEQAMTFTKKYFMAFMIFGVMIGTIIFGVIASLIGAAIAKKKPVNPLDQLNL